MLKNFVKITILFSFSTAVLAGVPEDALKWSGNKYKIIKSYTKVHRKYFKQVCTPGTEQKYLKLLRNYRGQGFYLPKLNDDIDRKAIINNLHHFRKKLNYIERTITQLKKQEEFPKFAILHVEIDKVVKDLLNLKKLHHQTIRKDKQKEILKESNQKLTLLKKHFDILLNQVYFLKSYNFPNDFLEYRKNYEAYKSKDDLKHRMKANQLFFLRRIYEDGAYDPNHTRPDKYIRTTLDTLYLAIQNEKDFISENVRYDLEWIETRLERLVDRGKAVHLARLQEWKERTQNNYEFYKELIKTKNKNKTKFLVKKENESSQLLKDFVYAKQAEAYNFWAKQSELHKAMFSLETILVNEVGVLDEPFGLERVSVAEVVLNRLYDDFYNQLEDDQLIHNYIDKDIDKKKEKWLNVLFKVGEFSFTYHYIPAVEEIFCPDMSGRGKSIREKNLKLSLKAMKEHDMSFNAFRYFSRISMLGKIDMSTVWTDYVRMPEMVGYKSSNQRKLTRFYLSDKYQYLYSFLDAKKIEYTVVKIDDETFSMRWIKGKPVFFDYRNPHLFAYFSKKK